MDVTFLGTAGAIPTTERNPSGIFVGATADDYLLDVGEGTARQTQRYATGQDLTAVFVTHVHGDHVFGLPGLLRTMAFYDRSRPLDVFTPLHTGTDVRQLVDAADVDGSFPVAVTEVDGGERVVDSGDFAVETFETDHGTRSVGYKVVDSTTSGESSLVYTGDTRPSETTVAVATGADLHVHDGMFEREEGERARETGHSTSAEAADVGRGRASAGWR